MVDSTVQDGSPIELFLFQQGAFRYGFTSGSVEVYVSNLGVTFYPETMTRGSIGTNDDVLKNNLSITMTRASSFALELLNFANENPYQVSVFRGDWNQDNWILNWRGRVVSSKADGDEIAIECESLFTTIQRPGLRARYSKMCRHELYDQGCKVNINNPEVTVEGPIEIIDGLNISAESIGTKPDGFFTAGLITFPNIGMRFITNHVGNTITISRPISDLSIGMTVSVSAGCDHLISTCQDKFSNTDNFGGFPWIPTNNPFGGGRLQ